MKIHAHRFVLPILVALSLAACSSLTEELVTTPSSETPIEQTENYETTEGTGEDTSSLDDRLTTQALADRTAWPVLNSNDTNRDVVTLQYLLRERGYSVSVNGRFDSATNTATKAFQTAQKLGADGIVGNKTWEKLVKTVRKGDKNNAVRALQDQLVNQYKYSISVDGDFGNGTHNTVVSFQGSKGLSKDGIVGSDTWYVLLTGNPLNGGGTSTDIAKLAKQILDNKNITLSTSSSTTNGNPRQNIVDTAAGKAARAGCSSAGGGANCGGKIKSIYLRAELLRGMLAIARNNSFFVTSIAGGQHGSEGSDHYKGTGLDIGTFNGVSLATPNSSHTTARNACISAGSIPSQTFNAYNDAPGGHSNHVHCAWPRQ